MKKSLLTIAVVTVLALSTLSAQTSVTTWYIIPPTNGCNGVWAVDALTYGPCAAGGTYTMNPMGCVQLGGPTVADTTYLTLCAFPCDLAIYNMQSGQTCICSTGTVTGAGDQSAQHITTTYPNPATTSGGWNILLHQPGESVTVNIYNTLGELVVTENHPQSEQIVHIDVSSLPAGSYIARITVNDAVSYSQQLIISR